MRFGIRLQLLLALGSLLVLAFIPLFFAVASLTQATLTSVREGSARALGRAICAHVSASAGSRAPEAMGPLLDAQVGQDGVAAIGVYGPDGARLAQAGDPAGLPASLAADLEQAVTAQTSRGAAILVVVPSSGRAGSWRGAVATLIRTDPSTVPAAPLLRLVGLYTAVVAVALLVFAYFSLTRMVVQPVEQLSGAARRVAEGARKLDVPRAGPRELADLGASLKAMTDRLRADEEALRTKVEELERTTRDLTRAQERLVRSERLASVGRLAAGLAHEIGNPIAAILGFQELLLAGDVEASEQRDFLVRMKKETERIHRVLRDLLDFARPAVRSDEPDRAAPGIVADAIKDVVALVAPQKAFRGLDIAIDVAPGLPPVALAHERIVQVLLNLLLNAADAAPRVGGRIAVRAARGRGGVVSLEVEDNGSGVAPEVQDRLFEPFVTTKEVGKGTGLGLAVCRGLVEAAGGTIGLERGSYGGARFALELPEA